LLPAEVIVHRWFTGRRKGLLASVVAGTIDQPLFDALKGRHLPLRHLALVSKVVVLDEVHAADPFMSTLLERTVEWPAAYGRPLVLPSAPLHRARRDALFEAYERGRSAGLAAAPPGERSATTEVPVPAGPEVTADDYPV